jgi:uncharacterized membrane protein
MLGLTPLGAIHTAISLVALVAGIAALARDKEIVAKSTLGKTYIWATVLTCLTGFGIFQHGGFGKPHALGVITLVVLALAVLAARTTLFGRASRYVETISYTMTFFFHLVPGFTETGTRLPAGAPLFANPDDPALQRVIGIVFVVVLIGIGLQVRRLRAAAAISPSLARAA